MLELLQLSATDKLMEIGGGSGTQTRAFALTGAEVHSLEIEPYVDPTIPIGECVFLHNRDGRFGLEQEAPFDAIAVTCGVGQLPKAWCEQLKEGGRLVAPVGDTGVQRLTLFRKKDNALIPERIAAYVRFQMLREDALDSKTSPLSAQ